MHEGGQGSLGRGKKRRTRRSAHLAAALVFVGLKALELPAQLADGLLRLPLVGLRLVCQCALPQRDVDGDRD